MPVLFLLLFTLGSALTGSADEAFRRLSLEDRGSRGFASLPHGSVLLGTSRGIYRFDPEAAEKGFLFSIPTRGGGVLDISLDRSDPSRVVAITGQKIFRSENAGERWEEIPFHTRGEWELQSILLSQGEIWLGTTVGLFRKGWGSPTWKLFREGIGREAVFDLVSDPSSGAIYVGTEDSLYRIVSEESERLHTGESVSEVVVGPEGVYFLSPSGLSVWESGQSRRLVHGEIDAVTVSRGGILAYHSELGLFLSSDRGTTWRQWPQTIPAEGARLFWDETFPGRLWLLTDQAVWVADRVDQFAREKIYIFSQEGALSNPFESEPAIDQVHRAAIAYAGVSQAYPHSWRRRVRKKGWLPKLEIGVGYARDRDTGFSVDDTVFGSSTQQIIVVGPDDAGVRGSDGEKIEYDIGLEWDLSSLIYDSDELSVAKQVEDLIELRGDILDQVTKVYYQRRRLQWELYLAPPEEELARIELELRIAELTALLDSWTGGRFSLYLGGGSQ